jgi:hypothetical protein
MRPLIVAMSLIVAFVLGVGALGHFVINPNQSTSTSSAVQAAIADTAKQTVAAKTHKPVIAVKTTRSTSLIIGKSTYKATLTTLNGVPSFTLKKGNTVLLSKAKLGKQSVAIYNWLKAHHVFKSIWDFQVKFATKFPSVVSKLSDKL